MKHLQNRVNYSLTTANGSAIPTYGVIQKELDWTFVTAKVTKPIISADLLKHYHLLPDFTKGCLLEGKTLCSTQGIIKKLPQLSVNLLTKNNHFPKTITEMLQKYSNLLNPWQYHCTPLHDITHYIETEGTQYYAKPRRLPPNLQREVQNEFNELEHNAVVQRSKSKWASPIVVVKIPDRKIRVVGDYRILNSKTVPERYPLPDIRDCTQNLSSIKIFSKIDLAPAIFQRFLSSLIGDLPFVFIYIDDILVYSESLEQHYEHLDILLSRLAEFNYNVDKCSFANSDLIFLKHKIMPNSFFLDEDRIEVITGR